MTAGMVFDVQRYSLHDGPGLRTLVFLKGCPLRCAWCSNPESQSPDPQLLYDGDACTLCLTCIATCPSGALTTAGAGSLSWDLTKCVSCGACVRACPNGARRLSGERMTVERVLNLVLRDAPFYRQSGGGVTLGGGEPTYQADFARKLLEAVRANGVDTALETCGQADTREFLAVAELSDHVLFDIKHMDRHRHVELTGLPNELILDNLRALMHLHRDVTVRYPLIPGWNDDLDGLRALARYLAGLPRVPKVELIPYHRFGEHKYRLLGRTYRLAGAQACEPQQSADACAALVELGIDCDVLIN